MKSTHVQYLPLFTLITGTLIGLTLLGCDREGPAERAGQAVDKTLYTAGDKLESAAENAGAAVQAAKDKLHKEMDR